ncbi:MAG: phage tail tape measure protein [Solobacterium sp.]|nr:phage tail tape measure protein [Solobacterium sp.]
MADELKRVGLVFAADGTTDFQKSLKNVSSELKENQNQFKKTTQAYTDTTTGLQKLTDKMDFSRKQMETYGDKVTLLGKQLTELKTKEEENSKALDAKRKSTEQLRRELGDLLTAEQQDTKAIEAKQKELEKSEKELSKLVDQENKYNAQIKAQEASLTTAKIAMEKYAAEVESAQKKIKSGSQQLEDWSDKLDKVSDKAGKIGNVLTAGVTAPITAVKTASMAAWTEVDDAMDIILKKTGATGDALDGFSDVAKTIATTIPTSFEAAATAVGEVNTRFGSTGKELENLSSIFIKFANVNDTDLNGSIDTTQKLLEAYSLTIEDVPALLDAMTAAGQASGVSMDTLGSQMLSNAATLREMGFGAADAVTFLARMEKSGIETSDVLAGMKKGFANSLKDGISFSDSLAEAFEDSTAAIDLFGSKAGPTLYSAFQNGSISIFDFQAGVSDLNSTLGTLETTYEALQDPTDQLAVMMNQIKIAGAEVGEAIMPLIQSLIDTGLPIIRDLTAAWTELNPETQEAIVKIALLAASVGPAFKAIQGFTGGISSAMKVMAKMTEQGSLMGNMITGIGSLLTGPAAPVIIIGAIIAALVTLYQHCEGFRDLVDGIISWFMETGKAMYDFWAGIFTGIGDFISNLIDKITCIPGAIKELISGIKAPHFTLAGSLNPIDWIKSGGLPTIGIDWFADGGILQHPTVFGTNGSTLMAGGEAGPEAVAPISTLMDYIRSANSEQTAALGSTMQQAVYAAIMAVLSRYKPGVYIDNEKVGEVFNSLLTAALR